MHVSFMPFGTVTYFCGGRCVSHIATAPERAVNQLPVPATPSSCVFVPLW